MKVNCANKNKVFKTSEASTKSWFRVNGFIDDYLNIIDLNGFRKNNTKWSNYARQQYGVEGRLFLEREDGSKAYPNKEIFKQIDEKKGILYQLTSTDNPAIKELDDKLKGFLDKIGVKIQELPEGDFVAKAKLVEKIIQVVNGKADVSTLPEEASHFFVSILKANGSIYQKMEEQIVSNPIYQEVLNEYGSIYTLENGSPDISRIKEEAIGKLISRNVVKLHQNSVKEGSNFLQRAWNMIVAVINKGLKFIGINTFAKEIAKAEGSTVFEVAAEALLTSDLSGLKLQFETSSYELLQVSKDVTQQSIVDAIRGSQSKFTSVNEEDGVGEKHYYILNKGESNELRIEGTPSGLASQDTRKRNKGKFVSESQRLQWEKIRTRGKKVHSWVEDITKNYVSSTRVLSTELRNSLSLEEKIHYDKAEASVHALIDSIKAQDSGAVFLTEVILHDPKFHWVDDFGKTRYGIAGSIDLLVIHSDGTASIYDYKTTSKKAGLEDISIWKSYEYNVQLSLYKRMLLNGNLTTKVPKVNGIFKSRIIQIETASDDKNRVTSVNFAGEIPVAGEGTGNKRLDSKLEALYMKFNKMMKLKPPSDKAEKKLFYSRISSIRDTIVNLHLRKNYNTIISNADTDFTYVNELFNKEAITWDDLAIAKEISDLYVDLLSYADLSAADKDIESSFKDIQRKADIIADRVLQKREEMMQGVASEFGIDDIGEVQRQLGFMGRYFRSVSTQNNPMVATLYEMTKKVLYQNEIENNALREEITNQQEVLKKWASSKGLSLQEAYNLIINKETGKLITPYTQEYYTEIEKRKISNDKEWFNDNFSLNTERYNKRLESFTKSIKEKTFSKNPALNEKKQNELINEFKEYESNLVTSSFRELKPSKQANWKSDSWKKLESDGYEPLRDFYKFFTSKTEKMAGWLPAFNHSQNFIPTLMKTWVEELSRLDGKTAGNLYQALRKRVDLNDLSGRVGNINSNSGEIGGQIPVFFINNLSKEDLKDGKKSYDLGRVLQVFGEMAHNFKNMSEIETAALAGLDIIKEQEAFERSKASPLGLRINPATQNIVKSKEANKGNVEMYEDFMNYFLYGVSTKNPSKTTKFLDGLNQYTAFKMLGLNPFPAIAATAANVVGTQIQIARNVYFDDKQFAKSLWMMSGGNLFDNETKEIAYGLKELFLPQIDNRQYAKNRKLSTSIAVRNITVDHFFAMLRVTDEINQTAVFLSMLQNSVFDKDGKIILMSDYKKSLRPENYYSFKKGSEERRKIDKEIKEKLKDTKSIMDLCSIKDGKLSIEGYPEISSDVIMSFRQLVKQVNKNIIGNMDTNDPSLYKFEVWGRMLFIFRNWMPRAVEERYGELRYNRELQRIEMGRYRTFFSSLFGFMRDESNKLKWAMSIGVEEWAKIQYEKQMSIRPELANKVTESQFIDLMKENMAATKRGLAITTGVILTLILGSKYFNDDEELTPGEKYTLKIWKRVYTEMSMFINPIEALNILKSPSAATAPLSDLIRACLHSLKEVGGYTFNEEDWIQNAHPLKYWMGFNPFSGIEKTYRMFDQDWLEMVEDNKKSE